MKNDSQIIERMTGLLYPFILLLGFYIILNGHTSPGGGFQGGAVLASVFIGRFLVCPREDFRIQSLQLLEKVFFICILLVPTLFLFVKGSGSPSPLNLAYLMAMNILIGLKVCSGLTVIFFRFVFYEGAGYEVYKW